MLSDVNIRIQNKIWAVPNEEQIISLDILAHKEMRSFFEFDQYGYLMRVTDLILNQDIVHPSNYGLLQRKIYIIVNFFSWGRINTHFVFFKFSYNKLE